MDKSCHYYLSSETSSSEHFVCFRAVFTQESDIKRCYIVASSLREALMILYKKLSPIWTPEYLDNHLIKLEFNDSFL